MSSSIVAIGDLHGHSDMLGKLLDKVNREWTWNEMVFLGDYIDRALIPRE